MRIDEGQRLILAVFGMLPEEETDAVLDFIDRLLEIQERGRTSLSPDPYRAALLALAQLDAALALELAPRHITKALDRPSA